MGNVFGTKRDTDPPIPSAYYIGLSTKTPTAAGENVGEPSAGGYARQTLSDILNTPSDGVITNKSDITFAKSTASWGTVTHFVIYDAPTGGNLLMYGALSPTRMVEEGTIMTIPAGSLKLSLLNPS
jgi:hypothetical protein